MPEVMRYRYIRFCKTQDVRFVLLKAIIELVDNVFYNKHFGSGIYRKKKNNFFSIEAKFLSDLYYKDQMILQFLFLCFKYQLKPEMERYEWVVINHPELASKTHGPKDTATSGGQSADNSQLRQPEKSVGELSPFLSAHHFNLNSNNTSMFMAGNIDSIIVGEPTVKTILCCVLCIYDKQRKY